jgi:hypothetical protein
MVSDQHGLAGVGQPFQVTAGPHRNAMTDLVRVRARWAVRSQDGALTRLLETQHSGRVCSQQLGSLDRDDAVDLVGGALRRNVCCEPAQRGLFGGESTMLLGCMLGRRAQLQEAPLAQRHRAAEQEEDGNHHGQLSDKLACPARIQQRQRVNQAAGDQVGEGRLRRVEERGVESDEQQ